MASKKEDAAKKRKPSVASKSPAAKGKEPAEARTPADRSTSAGRKAASARTKTASAGAASRKSAAAKTSAKKSSAKAETKPESAVPAKSSAPAAKKTVKPRKTAAKSKAEKPAPIRAAALTGPVEDPIGDTTDGEAQRLLTPDAEPETGAAMMEAYRADTTSEAEHGLPEVEATSGPGHTGEETDTPGEAQPEPHLERLQKILSQAGIASRRHAEEMIVAGRVMVNGQAVTQLGAKADPARDHIRVDGKMIQGAERRRTFVLNKPKGYVTTVSDPEGRPTVMQFFEKMRERLYPVGRLDYQSEGLLLMTNDGELANGLTRAAAGVEKTYLVKVAGQPSEDDLEQLRSGVNIDREQEGSGRVRTAPASVRQVRPGQNPWYEVVLTEGRNRELRKMFQAIGHFVEKIRRVGYGPLVLDVEPGQFRELSAEEVNALRLTAEGKLKPRRPKSLAMLPREAGRGAEARFEKRGERRGPPTRETGRREAGRQDAGHGARPERPFRGRDQRGKPAGGGAAQGRFQEQRFGGNRQAGGFGRREGQGREWGGSHRSGSDGRSHKERGFVGSDLGRGPSNRPQGQWPKRRDEGGAARFDRPREGRGGERPRGGRPRFDRPERPRTERPAGDPMRGGRPGFERRENRPAGRGRQEGQRFGGRGERRVQFGINRPGFEQRPRFERPDRGRGEGFRIEELGPRPDARPRQEGANRSGADRGEWKRPEGGTRPQRPSARREGAQKFGGPARPGGGNPRRGAGSGAAPGGFRRPGFRGKPGGGSPRRDRE